MMNNTWDYKMLFPVCEVEILQVTVIKLKLYHLFRWISDRKGVPGFLADIHKDG